MSVTQYLKDIMNWSCTEDYSHMVMFIMCLINVQKIIADATFVVAKRRREKMFNSHLFQGSCNYAVFITLLISFTLILVHHLAIGTV